MGIKSLSLQMIPWCFHVMGSTTACHHTDQSASPIDATAITVTTRARGKARLCIRLIRADGRVEMYDRPVSASELMKEHPMHLVCRSDAFTIGQHIPALAEGEQLQPGHAYFLLPLHFFQSVLSFVTLASSFARAAAAATSNGSASPLLQRPFDVQRTPSGKLQIRVCDDFIRRIQEAQEAGDGGGGGGAGEGSGGGGRVCTTAALEKDYRQLVVGCRERQWKPKLETIRELERRRGKLVAMGGAAGALEGIRRRRKKGHQQQVEPDHGHGKQQQLEENQQHHQKQTQKISTVAKHVNSPTSHKSKGKNVVACHV